MRTEREGDTERHAGREMEEGNREDRRKGEDGGERKADGWRYTGSIERDTGWGMVRYTAGRDLQEPTLVLFPLLTTSLLIFQHWYSLQASELATSFSFPSQGIKRT